MTRSVASQTDWCWLKDLEELARISREYGAEFTLKVGDRGELLQREKLSRTTLCEGIRMHQEESMISNEVKDGSSINGVECPVNNRLTGGEMIVGDLSHQRRTEENLEETPSSSIDKGDKLLSTLPSIAGGIHHKGKEVKPVENLVLPPITSVHHVADQRASDHEEEEENQDVISADESEEVSVSSLTQLEQLTFPFFEDRAKNDGKGTLDDGDESKDTRASRPISAPRLKLDNLSWPMILQYMRESESLTSEYFSIDNKAAIKSRIESNKKHQKQSAMLERGPLKSCQRRLEGDELVSSSSSSSEEQRESEDKEGDTSSNECHVCDFCGQPSPQVSLLQMVEDKEQDADLGLCCEGKKEFCVLIAVCMRQMMERLRLQKPKKISVELTKKIVKKTAEERALEVMQRQQKWEELRRRQDELQQTAAIRPSKHTQIIQFSLLSSGVGEEGWMVRPESSTKHQTPKQKQEALRQAKMIKRKKEESLRKGVLQPKTIARLKQEQRSQPPHELKVMKYGDGKSLAVLLHDGTGQVYYHSGNQAITIFSPYDGVLAYLVYEDCPEPHLLAYADELGRITCYNSDGKIRLQLRPSGGLLFDDRESVKKHWSWSKGETVTDLQPFTFSLNSQTTVKLFSQEKFLLTFSGSKLNHVRFTIESKLMNEALLYRDDERHHFAQSHLFLVKNRISQLLHILKQSGRPQPPRRKHSLTAGHVSDSWQSIYSTKTVAQSSRGDKVHTNGRKAVVERRRTRSTGGVNLQKRPLNLRPVI